MLSSIENISRDKSILDYEIILSKMLYFIEELYN